MFVSYWKFSIITGNKNQSTDKNEYQETIVAVVA